MLFACSVKPLFTSSVNNCVSIQYMRHFILSSLAASAIPRPALANGGSESNFFVLLIIAFLMVVIVISQISRRKHKRGKLTLQLTQRELEERVQERTVELKETQDYLNSIIHSMPSVLIGVSEELEVTLWNDAACRVTRISAEDAIGKDLFEAYPNIPVDRKAIRETLSHKAPHVTENLQLGTGSQATHLDITIYPLQAARSPGAVIRLDDVTQRVRMENMIIQNEKMMSLGELAAGMAHEINNPLSAIINNVQNIQRRITPQLSKNQEAAEQLGLDLKLLESYLQQREVLSFLDNIREAGDRSAQIVTNMLEFSRTSNRDHLPTDFVQLLENALNLARNSFELKTVSGNQSIELVREFESDLPQVPCSKTEMQQVILNLLRNACQCFTSQLRHEEAPRITLRLYRWDDRMCLEIADNGPGMNEDISRHIFEPFFTTKDVGQGTGLGLSVTYFIVTEHHGGTIEVESSPGQGTNFIISLPLHGAQHPT